MDASGTMICCVVASATEAAGTVDVDGLVCAEREAESEGSRVCKNDRVTVWRRPA